ncbi:Hypothetical predicted protein [Paramuricea clavata]|uniref:Uncharacterized protein n=1 Tax=Paramuricea clavata TaxID=317549 RepID=A0A6S7GPC0_PARCT|nr:Hypothetical predicted protein [Paramuricea clavata]
MEKDESFKIILIIFFLSACVKKFGSPDWRCPSDGVHCILKCVSTYGPGYTEVLVKPGTGGITTSSIGGGLGTRPGKGTVIKVPKKKPKTLQPTTEATTPPVVFLNPVKSHSSELPYCKSRDVNEILRPAGSRTKRAVSWPYECRHASILHFSGDYQFIWPIYDCCSKCSFPEFTLCVAKSRSKNSPEWMCPSEGLQCIVGCVNKHKPGGTIGILPNVVKPGIKPGSGGILPNVVKPGIKPAPGKPVLSNCEKLETENGKQCIRKLCVPLGQAFKP